MPHRLAIAFQHKDGGALKMIASAFSNNSSIRFLVNDVPSSSQDGVVSKSVLVEDQWRYGSLAKSVNKAA